MDNDSNGLIYIFCGIVIGFLMHWIWKQDLLSLLGVILFLMVLLNMTASFFYKDDPYSENVMLIVLQGMQLIMVILISSLNIIPVVWAVVFMLGVLRVSYICWKKISDNATFD